MLSKVYSAAIYGIEAYLVEVEVDIFWGLPGISLVGLLDTAVQESKERVRSAIKHSNFQFPGQRITINMAPANTRKYGPAFDLAIAIGLLLASEQILVPKIEEYLLIGELSLDGSLRAVEGALAFAMAGIQTGIHKIIAPEKNADELNYIPNLQVYPAHHLNQICAHLQNQVPILPCALRNLSTGFPQGQNQLDLQEIKGQHFAKRGLEIAAAGGHNLLMVGPPGSGKTMLAKSIAGILPPLKFEEALESKRIYSINGLLKEQALNLQRPFRSPHHSISKAGLIGGNRIPKPGEISLSHNGILFLDELPEFSKSVLEVLRQPLEEGSITISRADRCLTFPARCQVISAMNPCPCGYSGEQNPVCSCSLHQIRRYWQKISGPLMDRLDLHIEVPKISSKDLIKTHKAPSSQDILQKVIQARKIQEKRYQETSTPYNAKMSTEQIRQFCLLSNETKTLLSQAIDQLGLSARSYHHILKIARTIADLDATTKLQTKHFLEAIQFRSLDQKNRLSSVYSIG